MVHQHVTDPETCIQCSACQLACSMNAIEEICGRYCVDADKCQNCGKCIAECPTGAADSFVDTAKAYSIDEQATWTKLPEN